MDESISLRELVDVDIIQSIQDRFAKTVGVSSVIFLPDGDALTRFSNPTKFCSLIQSTKEGRRRCFQSFAEMSRKAVELSDPEIMYCFAHGAHFVAPIIIDGERKATMYAGQFRPEKFSPEQLKELEKIAVEIDLDPELLVKEAKKARVVGEDVVRDYSHLLFRTVEVIAELGAQTVELRQTKDALQDVCDRLEMRVRERTAELAGANEELRREVAERKAIGDALRESEAKYRLFTETSKDAILSYDMDGRITYLNRAAIELGGYSKEEALQMDITDILPRDQLLEFYERFSMRAAGGSGIVLYEVDFINKSGERISVEVSSSMIAEDDKPVGLLLACRDITERKRIGDALRKSEEKYRVLFETAKDAIFVTDEIGKFVDVNRAACESLGYSREELLRLSNREIDADPTGYAAFLKVRDTPAEEAIFEVNQQRKDGTLLPVEITGKFFKVDGTLLSLAIARDTTERKRAEDALRGSEEKLRSIVEQSSDGIVLVDEQGTIIEWNRGQEQITGLSRAEVLGRHMWDVQFQLAATDRATPAVYEQVKAGVLKLLETGQSERLDKLQEAAIKRPDGARRVIQVAVFPIKTDKGFMAGAISRDITERKQAEETLRESEAKIRALLNAPTDAMILIDSAGIVLAVNNTHVEWLKKSIDEIIGTCIFDLFPSDIAEFRKAQTNVVFNTGKPIHFEESQKEKIFNTNVYPVCDAKGKVTAVAVYAQDITERKQAEAVLRDSEEKFRAVLHAAPDLMIVLDAGGRYRDVFTVDPDLLVAHADQLLGKTIHEMMPEKSAQQIQDVINQTLSTGKLQQTEYVLDIDGVDRWFAGRVAKFTFKNSECVLWSARDITERKQAEERIEHLNSVLAAIKSVNQLIMVEKDRDALLRKACDALIEARGYDAAWLGLSEDGETFAMVKGSGFGEGVSRFCEHVLSGDHPPCIRDALAWKSHLVVMDKSMVCGDCFFESTCRGKEAAIIRVEHAGRFFGLLAVLLAPDVTMDDEEKELLTGVAGDMALGLHNIEMGEAHKKAEDRIKASLKEKEVLLREIHHRVKNNLQVISSLLNMQARIAKDKDVQDALSESMSRINAMSLIHNQLYGSENLSEVNMKGFVDNLVGQLLYVYSAQDTRITPNVSVADSPLPISIAVPVGLIVNELLSNAFKHAFVNRNEGTIGVSLGISEKGLVSLTVSDDGVGLPPGFDINAVKTLGLRLVKILTKDQLQGNLEVTSEDGATFKMEFDITDD